MRDIKFRFRIKHRQDDSIIFTFISMSDYKNGLIRFPIDTTEWEILNCDQFTGLYDKHKKPIFEGDIVKDDDIYLVEYKDAELVPFNMDGQSIYSSEWFEIIGNIYENPELLEDK